MHHMSGEEHHTMSQRPLVTSMAREGERDGRARRTGLKSDIVNT